MGYLAVDLGTTNIKAAAYDDALRCVAFRSVPVVYQRDGGGVEFDAEAYADALMSMVAGLAAAGETKGLRFNQIVFCGQAESLVALDSSGAPLMNAISWMDERSLEECAELGNLFPQSEYEAVTGQLALLPTWPATKILWLKRHKPDIFSRVARYMLLKDYVVYRLTGEMLADMSIATFSFYFDIYNKRYWQPMLDACGIDETQLPPLVEPCTVAGKLRPDAARRMGLTGDVKVNVGTLDHFAGMVGTGNVKPGGISLATGTVMALATLLAPGAPPIRGIAAHYGFMPDTCVLLPVAESGGVCLEWFRKTCMANISYDELTAELAKKKLPNTLVFLPYIVGTNAPEFDARASGMFWGLRATHDAYDMAYAVMEGVAYLLRKNCDDIKAKGVGLDHITATGGGSKSRLWCQLQADITGLPVKIPKEKEAACYGAAMIGAVSEGALRGFGEAAQLVCFDKIFESHSIPALERKYRQFTALYDAALRVADIQ